MSHDSPSGAQIRRMIPSRRPKQSTYRVAGCSRRRRNLAACMIATGTSPDARRSSEPQPTRQNIMKPRITVITLGVDDLERSLRFYRDGLGLKTEGIVGQEFDHGAVAFSIWKAARDWHCGRGEAFHTTQESP